MCIRDSPNGANIPITVWVEDDLDEGYDSRFGESNKITFYVNKSSTPYVRSASFPNDNNFRKDADFYLRATVIDDTNGRLMITVDGNELPVHVPYSSVEGVANVDTSFSLKGVPVGDDHKMVVMAVDEFGFYASSPKYTRSFSFNAKEPMELSNMRLSKETAENDDTVTVSGHVKDPAGKTSVYIIQKIDETSPVTLGSVTLSGGESDFTYNLKNLNNFLSGEHNISIIASYYMIH